MRHTSRNIEELLRRMILAPASYQQLYDRAVLKAKKLPPPGPGLKSLKSHEIARIEAARRYITSFLKKLALRSPFFKDLHPFHQELAQLAVNADEYRRCLALVYGAVRILNKIATEQKRKVMRASTRQEAVRARRQFFARMRSVLEDLDECFTKLRNYQLELMKLPNVDPELGTVIVAGPPNVGKSSLVRAVSRAKPEVREYPFTTKTIVVGHIELEDGTKIQVLDTPGLLDRPMRERNPIELQAILAMKHLPGVILFLFDPSETCGFPLTYQLSVYRDVRASFPSTPCIPVANKVDILDRERALALLNALSEDEKRNLHFISATERINVDMLVRKAIEILIQAYPSLGISAELAGLTEHPA